MALVNQVKKNIRMELWDIVRFQIHLYCYLNKILVTDQNLECLTLLALRSEDEIGEFCDKAAEQKIFANSQSARSALATLEKKGLINTFKIGRSKKRLKLNPAVIIQSSGNILLDLKIIRIEPQEGK